MSTARIGTGATALLAFVGLAAPNALWDAFVRGPAPKQNELTPTTPVTVPHRTVGQPLERHSKPSVSLNPLLGDYERDSEETRWLTSLAQRSASFWTADQLASLERTKRCLISPAEAFPSKNKAPLSCSAHDALRDRCQICGWDCYRRLTMLEPLVADVLDRKVPGDFIEAGVFKGGCSIFLAAMLRARGELGNRRMWLADSFEGLPSPREYTADLARREKTLTSLSSPRREMALTSHSSRAAAPPQQEMRRLESVAAAALPPRSQASAPGRSSTCSSNKPNDAPHAECQRFCNAHSAKSHCMWCKCRRCSYCQAMDAHNVPKKSPNMDAGVVPSAGRESRRGADGGGRGGVQPQVQGKTHGAGSVAAGAGLMAAGAASMTAEEYEFALLRKWAKGQMNSSLGEVRSNAIRCLHMPQGTGSDEKAMQRVTDASCGKGALQVAAGGAMCAIKGFFADTLPGPVGPIAFLRSDGDLYPSIYETLVALYPKLSVGGYVLFDDWRFVPAREAVHDFRRRYNITSTIATSDKFGPPPFVTLDRMAFWQKSRTTG